MRKAVLGFTCLSAVATVILLAGAAGSAPETIRVDYFHTGTANEEVFSFDQAALEGSWPGRLDRCIDRSNLGKYFFEVVDRKTQRVLYSRGFASIYGEWETTEEAKSMRRTFHESLRFPAPADPVQIHLKKRGRDNAFREVWSVMLDPHGMFVNRSRPPKGATVWAVMQNGVPQDKVDVLLIGDGYTSAEMTKWHADARRLTETLFSVSPFRENRNKFNVWAIDIASDESGVSRPSDGVWRRSALRCTYDAFGSERYVLTFDNKKLREVAAAAPYEFVEIVVNGRKYGGGGIYNLFATVVSDNESTPYIFVHEFGHHFAGLADEYYTSDVAYTSPEDRPEPWEPNVTADPKANRWKDLITPGTPLPTPWAKEEFEVGQKAVLEQRRKLRAEKRPEEEVEKLMREELRRTTELLSRPPYGGKVGAFEGAMYQARGYYRPQADCIMFTRNMAGFCAVCRRAILRVLEDYAR